jgi:hypothetical protein
MSTLKVDTIQDTSGNTQYTVKAWVNFNGTGTVAIRASGNVSSITDTGTGTYRVNFENSMPDNDYCVSAFSGNDGNTTQPRAHTTTASFSTDWVGIRNGSTASTTLDDTVITVSVIR